MSRSYPNNIRKHYEPHGQLLIKFVPASRQDGFFSKNAESAMGSSAGNFGGFFTNNGFFFTNDFSHFRSSHLLITGPGTMSMCVNSSR